VKLFNDPKSLVAVVTEKWGASTVPHSNLVCNGNGSGSAATFIRSMNEIRRQVIIS